jgi:hypothetical protein
MSAAIYLPTDAILIQAEALPGTASDMAPADPDAAFADVLTAITSVAFIINALAGGSTDHALSSARVAYSHTLERFYIYMHLARQTPVSGAMAQQLESALASQVGMVSFRASRLQKVFDVAGAAQGKQPLFHYVVEMDPETGWKPQLFQWYDEEHMPGLAAVPGCIQATRYLNHDHGPLSLACYDLVSEGTKGSPPWLAMTNTEWSSRMRPHFTNTLRTMLDVVPPSSYVASTYS